MRKALILFATFALAIGAGAYYFLHAPASAAAYRTAAEQSPYVRFDMEVYDIIMQHYWQKTTDAKLSPLYQLAAKKAVGGSPKLATTTRTGTADMLASVMSAATSSAARTRDAELIAEIVLYNLAPNGRSELLSQRAVTKLRDTVKNAPAQNLYTTLGVPKTASTSAIDAAYRHKVAVLSKATTTAAKQELAAVQNAHKILASTSSRTLYDTTGSQPTVSMRTINAHTLYVDMSQVTPSTFGEFVQSLSAHIKDSALTNLILDLRGNIGGALDFEQYFLGLFLGPNQYAFDLYHQGQFEPQRTPSSVPQLADLKHFSEIAVLTNNMTQSTAELTASSFQHLRLGYVVGQTSRGWGTVENTFPISARISTSTTYAVLLVHDITLRPDNQPIEGRGVTPNVDVTKPGWQAKLAHYFPSADMRSALESLFAK